MAEFDRLSVLLPPELAQAVRDAVDGERYAVESDVVIDALRDWQVKQQIAGGKAAPAARIDRGGDCVRF